jgi:hypothetical protein
LFFEKSKNSNFSAFKKKKIAPTRYCGTDKSFGLLRKRIWLLGGGGEGEFGYLAFFGLKQGGKHGLKGLMTTPF